MTNNDVDDKVSAYLRDNNSVDAADAGFIAHHTALPVDDVAVSLKRLESAGKVVRSPPGPVYRSAARAV